MVKHRIFTVGFELPGDDFEYIEFDSNQTLLDADIVLFEPTLGNQSPIDHHNGKPLLDEEESLTVKEQIAHWRSEILAAVSAGKVVIVYLKKPVELYRYLGDDEPSSDDGFIEISSYAALPIEMIAKAKSGEGIRLEKGPNCLASYWSEFSAYCPYEAEINGNFDQVLLRSRAGDRTIGAANFPPSGAILLLPPLLYDENKFRHFDPFTQKVFWTPEAYKFGNRLAAALAQLAENLQDKSQRTPAPTWALESGYRLLEESELQSQISVCASRIADLQLKTSSLKEKLSRAAVLRDLLFEKGRPLEAAVIEALLLFGFEAKPFTDGKSEFDVIFVSPEGRCLGEAEGKDRKPINIDKFSQLNRNLDEDFACHATADYAKGVLFGNAHRLTPLNERNEYFTVKCIAAAKRAKVALVRTPDLFAPARYLKESGPDAEYAKKCRKAIFRSEGDVAIFPSLPSVGPASLKAASAQLS
jgi:hypothetical protein